MGEMGALRLIGNASLDRRDGGASLDGNFPFILFILFILSSLSSLNSLNSLNSLIS